MNTKTYLIGLDLGTTTIKALAFEPNGRIVAEAGVPTPTHYPRPTWAYHDPEELWQGAASALRAVSGQLPAGSQTASIAVSSFGEAGAPLDAQGQPTYEIIAWFDQRTQPQLAWLSEHIGDDYLCELTGMPPQSILGLCKLMWLKDNEPEAFARTRHWLNGADYIAYRLSGVPATDYSLASRTLALNLQRLTWADNLLQTVGIPSHILAPLTPSGTSLGPVQAEAAQVTGLSPDTQVAVGGHDHVCGAFAIGVNTPDKMLNSLGTAEAIFLPLDRPIPGAEVGRQGYNQGLLAVGDRRFYFAFGGAFTSGGSVEWLRDVLSSAESLSSAEGEKEALAYETLIAEAEATPPGSLGVLFVPHLRIGSPPDADPKARGAFIGLSTDVNRGVLFRAVLEGIAFEIRQILAGILAYPNVPSDRRIYAIGGGTRNTLLMRLKATILNRPLTIAEITEATTLGAAMMGGLGANIYPDVTTALESITYGQTIVEPVAEQVPFYEATFSQVYQKLYPALRPLHHTIYELQNPTPDQEDENKRQGLL